jgi:hypothetical protein
MPSFEFPPFVYLERLLTLVAEDAPALLPGCRWLVLGPELGNLVLPEPQPTADEMADLMRLLQRRALDLLPLSRELIEVSDHGEAALLEICVDRLLLSSSWEHPTQVLERPRPDFTKLLGACEARLKRSRKPERAAIEAMTAKVERAVRIQKSAAERRQRMQRGRQRRKPDR